ncbi:MAG: helix-turn-helix transcriptional regulator [Candidatus Babeliales bacterium]|jgi:lambda repressor-like predicted transcriptional regulator
MKPRTINLEPSGMSPNDIRIAMIRSGVTQSGLARELGVTSQALYQIISGRQTSQRIREKIAERIGIDIKRIWPGDPIKPGRQTNQVVAKVA